MDASSQERAFGEHVVEANVHRDLAALAAAGGTPLAPALERLDAFYADIDARNEANTAALDLPCHRGCSACCEHSVFVTPLEFFGLWDEAQRTLSSKERVDIVRRGLGLYHRWHTLIDVFGTESDGPTHDEAARRLHYRCPLLDDAGGCAAYPRRELYGRLFGQTFNEHSGVYGCHLVGAHLADREVTLLSASRVAERFADLPMTQMRQVFPWYFFWLYGARDESGALIRPASNSKRLSVL